MLPLSSLYENLQIKENKEPTLIRYKVQYPASFLTHYYLMQGEKTMLLPLEKTYLHYQSIQQKLASTMKHIDVCFLEEDYHQMVRKEFMYQSMQQVVLQMGKKNQDEMPFTLLKDLNDVIESIRKDDYKFVILDDIGSLFYLHPNPVQFVSNVIKACQESGAKLIVSVEDESNREFVNLLEHIFQGHTFDVSGLESGFSKDVHGVISYRSPYTFRSTQLHFKTMERDVKFFSKGMGV